MSCNQKAYEHKSFDQVLFISGDLRFASQLCLQVGRSSTKFSGMIRRDSPQVHNED